MDDEQIRALLSGLAEYARQYGDDLPRNMKVRDLATDMIESLDEAPVPRDVAILSQVFGVGA